MFGLPFLLQYLLDTYGLRGATLLASCIWLSVGLAGALFGKGVTTIEGENNEAVGQGSMGKTSPHEQEHFTSAHERSSGVSSGLIYSRRTSLLPSPNHYHPQHTKRLSSADQPTSRSGRLPATMANIRERSSSRPREKSNR